ncbi:asparagine synthase (glutamine-hydrolyzing) [Telmatospirillum siberiense]|uniref:asparagine synthase (glutamine-hydrolyzing) n=1 Tax=Telmatospirillum siberiense TaxID=382514 RepID=A0A2N3PT07_9PROT|nr:asparagine synthase (glutamine-hydrolyzing) [Telmatospirillum siberiense]PKU23531.1 asparagine synthase (glutamine-hydrolyzing) [Telmatospirillum siberiense]
MCGLTGFFDTGSQRSREERLRILSTMTESIAYRGPDAQGLWISESGTVGLGHRRLSIIDLSPAGAQPMTSADGRFIIVYNGEGYNAWDLKSELEAKGHRFRGHSDTEVLCEGFSAWGVEECIRRFNGMFAIVAWDTVERRLWLVRDRLGIKPLHWAKFGELLMFGSELKCLRAHPGWQPEIDRDAVAAYLRHNYIPAPRTVYQGVRKLEPGHLLTVSADGEVKDLCYWSAHDVARAGVAGRGAFDETEAIDRLEALLTDAVHRQMVSDVPLGAFLSGGIDSSTVAALMRTKAGATVRTFSIGFSETGYDESAHAAAVARHLGTDHTELTLRPDEALALVPGLAEYYDEPFSDSSQLPTLLLSRLTRQHVTVALSGDGGDELFAGYNRYFWSRRLERGIGWIPPGLRRLGGKALRSVPPAAWDRMAGLLPSRLCPPQPGDKIHKLADVLALDETALYRRLISHWPEPERLVPGSREPRGPVWDDALTNDFPQGVDRMQYLDTVTYLPDDILTKVDRATMAVSLEARVPLLDHRVVEFAWSLPLSLKLRDGGGKWILKQVLYRHVPRELVERPKMGFGVPIAAWLRGPLRDWAEDLLDARGLAEGGLVDPAPVRHLWAEHLSGRRNWQYLLWGVLMLEEWRRRWMA